MAWLTWASAKKNPQWVDEAGALPQEKIEALKTGFVDSVPGSRGSGWGGGVGLGFLDFCSVYIVATPASADKRGLKEN